MAWHPERPVLSRLAIHPEEAADITSLAMCYCQSKAAHASNFQAVFYMLKRYRSLREPLFVRNGSGEYLAGLGNEEDELGGTITEVNSPKEEMWQYLRAAWSL